jgi:hypothetical protein
MESRPKREHKAPVAFDPTPPASAPRKKRKRSPPPPPLPPGAHLWEHIPDGKAGRYCYEVFDWDTRPIARYVKVELGNKAMINELRSMTLGHNYNLYNHMTWKLKNPKYGPTQTAISVPKVVLEAYHAKKEFEAEEKKERQKVERMIKRQEQARLKKMEKFKQMFPAAAVAADPNCSNDEVWDKIKDQVVKSITDEWKS